MFTEAPEPQKLSFDKSSPSFSPLLFILQDESKSKQSRIAAKTNFFTVFPPFLLMTQI
jgi:hypothetical protein